MNETQNQPSDPLVAPLTPATPPPEAAKQTPRAAARPQQLSIHQIYSQPAPLRTFPFPTLTSNPVSWVHLAVTWLGQVLSPPPTEPSFVHTAYWDNETRSILVTDEKSMASLWQQGFYGKGTLSRSEPNWLKREKIRQGVANGKVAEVNTDQRREDRARVKWERARAEQEALEQRRMDEAVPPKFVLPSPVASRVPSPDGSAAQSKGSSKLARSSPVGPLQLLALPNSHIELAQWDHARLSEDSTYGTDCSTDESGSSGNDDIDSSTGLKRRKSVRFSPNVVSTIFEHTDPPSPPASVSSSSLKSQPAPKSDDNALVQAEHSVLSVADLSSQVALEAADSVDVNVVNKEYLQLSPEEAFFLTYAVGALKVVDTATQAVIPTADLLTLLRQHSYFPLRTSQALQPDDPFLLHYAVYHHFRSLGWVPRPGVKFGVDCKSSSVSTSGFSPSWAVGALCTGGSNHD